MARAFCFPPDQIMAMDGPDLSWWGGMAKDIMQAEAEAMKEAMGG